MLALRLLLGGANEPTRLGLLGQYPTRDGVFQPMISHWEWNDETSWQFESNRGIFAVCRVSRHFLDAFLQQYYLV